MPAPEPQAPSASKQQQSASWHPASWKQFPTSHIPHYPHPEHLQEVMRSLEQKPPLVTSDAIEELKHSLAALHHRPGWILHAGDCAEPFHHATTAMVQQKCQLLHDLTGLLQSHIPGNIITIGRIAGQFAKPRSQNTEPHNNALIPSFRGDNIHPYTKDSLARTPDPDRLLLGYYLSHIILRDIKHCQRQHATMMPYISHEALILHYEQAMTHPHPSASHCYYNHSAHLLWIGDRTRSLDGGHLEYIRGIANPVAIKLGPTTTPAHITGYLKRLNPHKQEGKLLFITRMGYQHTKICLPPLIKAAQNTGIPVLWICDPMHGNTYLSHHGQKVRALNELLLEFTDTHGIHQHLGSRLHGIHLEITPEKVLECVPHHQQRPPPHSYTSYCDPRLNAAQSRWMMTEISRIRILDAGSSSQP